MLATVTERTREIGVRRALGAKRRDIIHQFLVESVVLTGVGGGLGVIVGFLCGPAVRFTRQRALDFFPEAMAALPPEMMELEPRIATWSIIASLFIAIAVGVVFGMYPGLPRRHTWIRSRLCDTNSPGPMGLKLNATNWRQRLGTWFYRLPLNPLVSLMHRQRLG